MRVLPTEKPDQPADAVALPSLWERMLTGDHVAFEKVYHTAFPKLYRYGCRITSEDMVEEIIQELFIHIWNKRNSLSKVSSPLSYLFCAFRNRLLNHISSKKKYQTIPLHLVPDFSYQVSEETYRTNQGDTLQKAINKLSHQQREVIYLLYFNDLSAQEVAEILSLKVRTVYNTAHNALNALRNHLQKDAFVFHLIPPFFLLYLLQNS